MHRQGDARMLNFNYLSVSGSPCLSSDGTRKRNFAQQQVWRLEWQIAGERTAHARRREAGVTKNSLSRPHFPRGSDVIRAPTIPTSSRENPVSPTGIATSGRSDATSSANTRTWGSSPRQSIPSDSVHGAAG